MLISFSKASSFSLGGFAQLAWMLLFMVASCAALAQNGNDYILGPQDELQIRVYDWRTGTGDEHQWAALTGTFVVGASGGLSLPLIGEIRAGGKTVPAVADTLAQMLQAKIGLAERPNASVEVVRYRPFYVIGSVDKPGEYAYRPGLTVLQSVALAGGVPRVSDVSALALERDVLMNRGEMRVLSAERFGLLARQARLDAELNKDKAITFSDELRSRGNDPDVARAVREETSLFITSNDAAKAQIEILNQARALGLREVDSLAAKEKALASQLDLTKQELGLVSGLVSKGLAVVPRQLALQQSVSQFEANQLDVQLASLRAQQEINRVNREISALDANRRSLALTESRDVRAKLAETVERMTTARNLLRRAEAQAPEVASQDDTETVLPLYRVTRSSGGIAVTSVVSEGDLVEPGDTVRVERRLRIQSADQGN